MDAAALDELRALRARAYGPDADIYADPRALARLRELEDAHALSSVVEPDRDAAPGGTAEPAAEPPRGQNDISADAADDPAVATASGRDGQLARGEATGVGLAARTAGWSTRKRRLIAVAVLVVAIVATAAISTSLARRASFGGQVEAVLAVQPDAEWPEFLMSDSEGSVYADFHGVTLLRFNGGWMGQYVSTCLYAVDTAEMANSTQSYDGAFLPPGCGAGDFPAALSFIVGPDMPEPLRERYPVGTTLQFVLDGSEVIVLRGTTISEPGATDDPEGG